MLDYRIETFLTLYDEMNYRRTAERLRMTQPGVTQHIHYLERFYGVKLFVYDGRQLLRTPEAEKLKRHIDSTRAAEYDLRTGFSSTDTLLLRVGATKTIGEFVLPPVLEDFLSRQDNSIQFIIDNTENLLKLLEDSRLDFAVIEGTFSKTKYDSYLLRMEPFVGICAKNSPLSGKHLSIEDLLKETIIVREEGSGTRRIFEERLTASGYGLNDFSREVSISSFVSIKALVAVGVGISFLYRSVVADADDIGTFTIDGITEPHPFHVVYTRNTNAKNYAEQFLGEQKIDK